MTNMTTCLDCHADVGDAGYLGRNLSDVPHRETDPTEWPYGEEPVVCRDCSRARWDEAADADLRRDAAERDAIVSACQRCGPAFVAWLRTQACWHPRIPDPTTSDGAAGVQLLGLAERVLRWSEAWGAATAPSRALLASARVWTDGMAIVGHVRWLASINYDGDLVEEVALALDPVTRNAEFQELCGQLRDTSSYDDASDRINAWNDARIAVPVVTPGVDDAP